MNETDEVVILPSDSRRRPDRKYLEKGNNDNATYWKKVIEEKQRSDRKTRKDPWQPIWFRKEEQPNPIGEGVHTAYVYCSDYWEQRSRKEESLQQGDFQFIEKMIPPQVLGTACDFAGYENTNLQGVSVQAKTDNAIPVEPVPEAQPTENNNTEPTITSPDEQPQTTIETVDKQETQDQTGNGNKDV